MQIYDEKRNCWIPLRETAEYQKRKKIVRDAWIIIGMLMLILPLGAQIALCLLSTFISFSFLDEGNYDFASKSNEHDS